MAIGENDDVQTHGILGAAQGTQLPDWYLISSSKAKSYKQHPAPKTKKSQDRLRDLCSLGITYPLPCCITWLHSHLKEDGLIAMDVADDGYCLFAAFYCCLRYHCVTSFVENSHELMFDTVLHLRSGAVKNSFAHRYKPKSYERWLLSIECGDRECNKFDALAAMVHMFNVSVILHKREGSVALFPKNDLVDATTATFTIAELENETGCLHYVPLFPEKSSALRQELGVDNVSIDTEVKKGSMKVSKKFYEPYDPLEVIVTFSEDASKVTNKPNKYAPQPGIADERTAHLQSKGILSPAMGDQRLPRFIQNICKHCRLIPYYADQRGVSFFNAIYAAMYYAGYHPYNDPDLIRAYLANYLPHKDFQLQYSSLNVDAAAKKFWLTELQTGGAECERFDLMEAAAKMLCVTLVVHVSPTDAGFEGAVSVFEPLNAPSRCTLALCLDWSMKDNGKFVCLLPVARGRQRTVSDLDYMGSPASTPNTSPVRESRTTWYADPNSPPQAPVSPKSSISTPPAPLPPSRSASSSSAAAQEESSSGGGVHEGPRFPILRHEGHIKDFFGVLRNRVDSKVRGKEHKNTYVNIEFIDKDQFNSGPGERMMSLKASEERMSFCVNKIKGCEMDPKDVPNGIKAARKDDNMHPVRVSTGGFSLFEAVYVGMYYLGEIDKQIDPKRIQTDVLEFLREPAVRHQYCKTTDKSYDHWLNGIRKNDPSTDRVPLLKAIAQMYRINIVWYTLHTPVSDVVFQPSNCRALCTIAVANEKDQHRYLAMVAYPTSRPKPDYEAQGARPKQSPQQSSSNTTIHPHDLHPEPQAIPAPFKRQHPARAAGGIKGLIQSITIPSPTSVQSKPGVQAAWPNQYQMIDDGTSKWQRVPPINTMAQMGPNRSVKVKEQRYNFIHGRAPLEPTPGVWSMSHEMSESLHRPEFSAHRNNKGDFNRTVHEMQARQLVTTNYANIYPELSVVMDNYNVVPLEVDGAGWCSFNAVFVSLWHAGYKVFENGFELYQSFVEYCIANTDRLNDSGWFLDGGVENLISQMKRGDTETDRMLQFHIIADWLQINLMVFSDLFFHANIYYPLHVKHEDLPTIAIMNVKEYHFISLIPIGTDDPPSKTTIIEKITAIWSVGSNKNTPAKSKAGESVPTQPTKENEVVKDIDALRGAVQRVFGGGRPNKDDPFVWDTLYQSRGHYLDKNLELLTICTGMSAEELRLTMNSWEADAYKQCRGMEGHRRTFDRNSPKILEEVQNLIIQLITSEHDVDFTDHVYYMCNYFGVHENEMREFLEEEKLSRHY